MRDTIERQPFTAIALMFSELRYNRALLIASTISALLPIVVLPFALLFGLSSTNLTLFAVGAVVYVLPFATYFIQYMISQSTRESHNRFFISLPVSLGSVLRMRALLTAVGIVMSFAGFLLLALIAWLTHTPLALGGAICYLFLMAASLQLILVQVKQPLRISPWIAILFLADVTLLTRLQMAEMTAVSAGTMVPFARFNHPGWWLAVAVIFALAFAVDRWTIRGGWLRNTKTG